MGSQYNIPWLIRKFEEGEKLRYIFFWGHTSSQTTVGKQCFSQWYEMPFEVEGHTYPTAEHWMMAQKALLFNDREVFEKILKAAKPGEVKELGRQVKGFNERRWEASKYEIVKEGNLHKFSQHADLKEFLLNTGDRIIVEASPVDHIWGIGLAADAEGIENPHNWKGQNLLGFALMEVRDELR